MRNFHNYLITNTEWLWSDAFQDPGYGLVSKEWDDNFEQTLVKEIERNGILRMGLSYDQYFTHEHYPNDKGVWYW